MLNARKVELSRAHFEQFGGGAVIAIVAVIEVQCNY